MAEIEKGVVITFKGDTVQFGNSVNEVNRSIKTVNTQLKETNKQLKLDPKNVDLLKSKLTSLGEKEKALTTQIENYKAEVEALGSQNVGTPKWVALQNQISKVEDQLKNTKDQITKTEDSLNGNFTEKLNDGFKKTNQSASVFGDTLKAKIVGEAIISGVNALVDGFKRIGTAIFDTVRDSGKLADDINTLAKQYNLTTKEIQQFMSASDLIDVDINTIAKSMSKLTKNMTSTSTSVVGAFKKLGVETKGANGELRDSNEVFNELISKLAEVQNETEQDSLAMEIFGKSAADLGPLINGGVEQLAEWNKYLEENNLLLSQDQLDGLNGMNDSFDKLTQTIELIKQKIAAELAPVIQPLIDGITKYIIENKDTLIGFVKDFIEYLTSEEAKEQFERIKETIEKVVDFMINSVPSLIEDIGNIAKALQPVLIILGKIVDFIMYIDSHSTDMYGGYSSYADMRRGGGSGGFGEYQSGGFNRNMTSNLTINVNTNQMITENMVRGWANIINEELGGMV